MSENDESTAIAAYVQESMSWDADRAREAQRSARRAWRVAGAACGTTVLALVAVMLLTPLKRVEPYLLRVDATSGMVDAVPAFAGVGARSVERELRERMARQLLQQYVTARERYVYAIAEQDYALVGALQTSTLNQQWLSYWARSNPQSPINRYQDGTSVRARVLAISFLPSGGVVDGELAQVRYAIATRPAGSGAEQWTQRIATVRFQWGKPSTDNALRALNPLGFRVLEWQSEPELTPDGGSPPAAVAVAQVTP
jgi:type IV secretion system protein VirB8